MLRGVAGWAAAMVIALSAVGGGPVAPAGGASPAALATIPAIRFPAPTVVAELGRPIVIRAPFRCDCRPEIGRAHV